MNLSSFELLLIESLSRIVQPGNDRVIPVGIITK